MDFAQQIEETLVERPPSVYDVVMESPLYATNNNNNNKMSSSINSTLDDTTPSDSGVQMMDSESSELMVESITSQSGMEFEEIVKPAEPHVVNNAAVVDEPIIDGNSNVAPKPTQEEEREAMTTSACSTFDTTESIVYRRKVRKATSTPKAPKKRVSFHEDILKNTRTDNIHIEHGFITYKNGRKLAQHLGSGGGVAGAAGRYSWCSERERERERLNNELCDVNSVENDAAGGDSRSRRLVYRNACSDVLDYGNADIYDTNEPTGLQYDNSGVFEYVPRDGEKREVAAGHLKDGQIMYRCACSSSNSSLDSDEQDKNSNHKQYEQAKSSSCDCIGQSNVNNNLIGDNCYYSEPNIDNLNDGNPKQKSVWNKEKMPKSSCLKKTKRQTTIIQEQDLNNKVKKFNVHDIKHQLLDNSSKMIFGSLKSIFTIPLPERGVPEGSEDLTSVVECVPEPTPEHKVIKELPQFEPESPPLKSKPFLSKSLDGSKQVKKFVHNVDEQLRRKNEETLFAPTRHNSDESEPVGASNEDLNTTLQRQQAFDNVHSAPAPPPLISGQQEFRNKFIINCESTVFEHTGVSYETSELAVPRHNSVASLLEKDTPIAQPAASQLRNTFMGAPIAKTFSNFFRSFKETATSPTATATALPVLNKTTTDEKSLEKKQQAATDNYFVHKTYAAAATEATPKSQQQTSINLPTTQSSSTISELSSQTNTNTNSSSLTKQQQKQQQQKSQTSNNSLAIGQDLRNNIEKQSRHLPSPLKKRASGGNLLQQTQPQRYGVSNDQQYSRSLHSPDLFNQILMPGTCTAAATVSNYLYARGGSGRDSKSTILSEEFDDILTITTTTDTGNGTASGIGNDKQTSGADSSDLVIIDYSDMCESRQSLASSSLIASTGGISGGIGMDYANLLKPPQPPAAKTSLINRFLRNVTQKKILESSIRKNNFFADKLRSEQKLLTKQLYVPGARPKNYELIDDLNAEIAMEIEMSGVNSPRRELAVGIESDLPGDVSRFELGIGEISIDVFSGKCLPILRDSSEQLLKVFKLYTGYSREGFMTPVLVFLTDKTLYVTDLVRNCLFAKFVLAYKDLDVILMGPFGNTVLLCNSARDMQQVLLAGGPYPADGLVANLEMCARRSGSTLPAVGQLTFEHLAPLQEFVRANSSVGKHDTWLFYAVVNVPAGALGVGEQEPLGPHVKGFLMHRRIKENASNSVVAKMGWHPGYFLLKAGVLYMFNDSSQKIPSWAMALAECQGARRSVKATRPHCFEIMLKGQLLQMAAPDEYVASEWLQAVLQSASGLFELQEKHKTLGCTLVVTQNHLITLREDFSTPLRQLSKTEPTCASHTNKVSQRELDDMINALESSSMLSSTISTPTRGTQRSCSSANSTPTKLSQLSRSTTNNTNTTFTSTSTATFAKQHQQQYEQPTCSTKESYTNMSSVYGKNSGLEILTCADIKEMTGIKISAHNETWWCILEFSCQEAPIEYSDDLVLFFASCSELQRFLRLVEQLWQTKNNDLFPITILDEDEPIAEQCTMLNMDINRAWEPLLSSAMGYPL